MGAGTTTMQSVYSPGAFCWDGMSSMESETDFKPRPLQVRTLVQQELYQALTEHDILISPAAPTTAYRLGAVKDDPLEMYKGDLMTININLAGDIPALIHAPPPWL